MPQTANKLKLFVREGGYEPEIGLRFAPQVDMTQNTAQLAAVAIGNILSDQLDIERWEYVAANGAFIDSGTLAIEGTWQAGYVVFDYMVHFTFQSAGTGGASGFFVPGTPTNAWINGAVNPIYSAAVAVMFSGLQGIGVTDSEGFALSAVRRFTASRRTNTRTAS